MLRGFSSINRLPEIADKTSLSFSDLHISQLYDEFRSCLHNQREGRVEIGIPLLFTQPEGRKSGDWDPAPVYTT
jgi:hypothetical protein